MATYKRNSEFMKRLRRQAPQKFNDITEKLSADRSKFQEELAKAQASNQEPKRLDKALINRLQLRLWVLTGVLDEGFDIALLAKIAMVHERIGSVP